MRFVFGKSTTVSFPVFPVRNLCLDIKRDRKREETERERKERGGGGREVERENENKTIIKIGASKIHFRFLMCTYVV